MNDHTDETDARRSEASWDALDPDEFDDFGQSPSELRLFADLPGELDASDEVPEDPVVLAHDVSSTPPRRPLSNRNVAFVIVGVAAILAVVAVVGDAFQASKPVVTAQTSAAPIQLPVAAAIADDFERTDSDDGLGMTPEGRRWDVVLGDWGIDRDAAYIADANGVGALRNMAVVDLGSSDGSIAVTVSGRGVCGVIVRYLDPFNFITLKRVSLYGVWNLEKVVGGETTRLTFLADPPTPTVDVRVDFRGSQLDVFVAGTSVTVNDTAGQTSGLVGLIGEQIDSRDCRWSSFRGWNVGGDA